MSNLVPVAVGLGVMVTLAGLVLLCNKMYHLGWTAGANHVATDLRAYRDNHLGLHVSVATGVAVTAALDSAVQIARFHARHHHALIDGQSRSFTPATSPADVRHR